MHSHHDLGFESPSAVGRKVHQTRDRPFAAAWDDACTWIVVVAVDGVDAWPDIDRTRGC